MPDRYEEEARALLAEDDGDPYEAEAKALLAEPPETREQNIERMSPAAQGAMAALKERDARIRAGGTSFEQIDADQRAGRFGGRSHEEKTRIVSEFTAEANRRGADVLAWDPSSATDVEEMASILDSIRQGREFDFQRMKGEAGLRHYLGAPAHGITRLVGIDPAAVSTADPKMQAAIKRRRSEMGMGERLATAGLETVGAAAAMGSAGKVLAPVAGRAAQILAASGYGAATNPDDPLSGAITMAALVGLGGAFESRIAEYLPKLPGNLRAVAASGGGNVLAGAVLGQTSPEEVLSNLVLGITMRVLDSRPDITEADLRRTVLEEVQARREVNAEVRSKVRAQIEAIDARNAAERGLRADAPKAALPAGPVQTRPGLPAPRGPVRAGDVVPGEGRTLPLPERPGLPEGAGAPLTPDAPTEPAAWTAARGAFQRGYKPFIAGLKARSAFDGMPTADILGLARDVGVDMKGVKGRKGVVARLVEAAGEARVPDLSPEQSGLVKARAVEMGLAEPAEVFSPERVRALLAATEGGATPEQAAKIVEDMGRVTREDGNVAEGHRPTADVLADPAIPEAQKAAIREAQRQGIATASSHVSEEGRGIAIGRDAKGRIRRVEADAPTMPSRGAPPPPPEGTTAAPAEVAAGEAGPAEQAPNPALDEALKRYGPKAEKPEGPRLGSVLGGASPRMLGKVADAPRNVLSLPGRLGNRPVSRGLKMLGTLLGKGVESTVGRIPGVKRAGEYMARAWGARRLAQMEFASAKDKGEGTRVQGEGFIDRTADLSPEQRTAGFDYLGDMNDPVKRVRAEKALGPEHLAALREGRAAIDANEKRNAGARLVGEEALRVHGAKEGAFGTHLRREYAPTDLEGEITDHLLRLSGQRAAIPPNELKRDKWIWKGKGKEYRKFETEAEARAYRKEQKGGDVIAPLSPEARAAMGEITDPGVVIARTIAMQDLQYHRYEALKAFAESSYASKTNPGGRFSPDPIPDDRARYGPLAGMYVDKALRSEVIARFGEKQGIDTFFDIMEKATGLWKAGKTIYNPASQMRNAFGNVAFAEIGNLSPARPSDYQHVGNALKILFAKGGTPEHALRVELARRGISRATSIGADLEGAMQKMAEARDADPRGLWRKFTRLVYQGPRTTWALVDSVPKAAAFLKEYRRTGSLDAAQKLVQESFPDYSRAWLGVVTQSRSRGARLTKAVFAPPFVNFLSESVRIAAKTAANKPVSLATGVAVLAALGALSKRAAGITDEEEKKAQAAAAPWMRAGSLAVPWFWDRDEEGNPVALDLRYILPLSKEINDLTGEDDGRQSMLGIVNNPILAPLIDQGMNRDRFYGTDLVPKGSSAEGALEIRLRALFDAYMPSLATKLTGFGRRKSPTWKALTGQKDRFGDVPDVGRSVMADLGGVTLRPVDVEKGWESYKIAVAARWREKESALKAAQREGNADEVRRIQRDMKALESEFNERRRVVTGK